MLNYPFIPDLSEMVSHHKQTESRLITWPPTTYLVAEHQCVFFCSPVHLSYPHDAGLSLGGENLPAAPSRDDWPGHGITFLTPCTNG